MSTVTIGTVPQELFSLQELRNQLAEDPSPSMDVPRIQKVFSSVLKARILQQDCSQEARSTIAYFCGLENKNHERVCQPLLLESASKDLEECHSFDELQQFCRTFEGDLALKTKNERFIASLYDAIRRILKQPSALQRFSAFVCLIKPYLSESELATYDQLAISLLKQHVFQHPEESLQLPIQTLRSSGLPLAQIDGVLSPHVEKLKKKWIACSEDHCATFSTTNSDTLTVEVNAGITLLQKTFSSDVAELTKFISSLPPDIQAAIICQVTAAQGKVFLSFVAKAMQAHVTLVTKTEMTLEESQSTLCWIEKLREDVRQYQLSAITADVQDLSLLSTELTKAIETIKRSIEEIQAHPEQHLTRLQKATSTAMKVARFVGRIFKWFPCFVLYVLPVAIATAAGYKADGVKGALFSAGVASTTTILSAFAPLIASKIQEEVASLTGIPPQLRPSFGALFGLSLHVMCLILAMQVNGFMAGLSSSLFTTEKTSTPESTSWYLPRLWNAAGKVKDSVVDFGSGIPTFLASEYGIATATIRSPQQYGEVFGRIINTAQAQIEQHVAGYHFGNACVKLPSAMWTLAQTTIGN